MTLYGDSNQQFRPRPGKVSLLLYSAAFLLIALQLLAIIASLVHVVAISGSSSQLPLPVYAPFAQKFQLPTLVNTGSPAREAAAPAAVLALGVIVLYLWPTSTSLASRVGSQLFTLAAATITIGATLQKSPLTWLEGDVQELWRPALLLVALVLVQQGERRAIDLFANVIELKTPLQRIVWWALRVPLPMAIVAAIASTNGYLPLAAAAGLVTLMSGFVQLSTRPSQSYERLDAVEMREAAAVTPIIALALVAGSIYLFGMPLAQRPNRAVIVGDGSFASMVPVERVKPAAVIHEERRIAAEKKRQEEQVIDIRWSDPKKAKKK